ncbi:hypothetical protein VOLCADRAFT_88332 [Volvox carteri f. nagariensis]|uniref:Uncharacterized protein n=1 Tax=Volvox carteri f. nagariensis TaxID=3068 RepID=D8TNX2_VOLCA|nr:uncharacterized protein VOLCADRAFT_88332 [Volvox carteri f. nagariensis]EFJ50917.1 hypothetical protein VOLCADRAFT_88332 [Volvox carteri f. nagariensis]|eukprot:XP_002947929.1 hypothetical protein VOLCADRAFT_88332 [Volvox carteri f. nagariensis]
MPTQQRLPTVPYQSTAPAAAPGPVHRPPLIATAHPDVPGAQALPIAPNPPANPSVKVSPPATAPGEPVQLVANAPAVVSVLSTAPSLPATAPQLPPTALLPLPTVGGALAAGGAAPPPPPPPPLTQQLSSTTVQKETRLPAHEQTSTSGTAPVVVAGTPTPGVATLVPGAASADPARAAPAAHAAATVGAAEAEAEAAAAALQGCLLPFRSLDSRHKELRIRGVIALAMSQVWNACLRQHGQSPETQAPAGKSHAPPVNAGTFSLSRLQLVQFGWTTTQLDEKYQELFPPHPPGRMSYSSTAIMYDKIGKSIAMRGLRTRPGGNGGEVVLTPCVGWGDERVTEMQRLRAELAPLEEEARRRQEAQEEAARRRAAPRSGLCCGPSNTEERREALGGGPAGGKRRAASEVEVEAAGVEKSDNLPWPLREIQCRICHYLRLVMRPLLASKDPTPLPVAEVLRGLEAAGEITLDDKTLAALGTDSVEALFANFMRDVVTLRRRSADGVVGVVPSEVYRREEADNRGLHMRCSGVTSPARGEMWSLPSPQQRHGQQEPSKRQRHERAAGAGAREDAPGAATAAAAAIEPGGQRPGRHGRGSEGSWSLPSAFPDTNGLHKLQQPHRQPCSNAATAHSMGAAHQAAQPPPAPAAAASTSAGSLAATGDCSDILTQPQTQLMPPRPPSRAAAATAAAARQGAGLPAAPLRREWQTVGDMMPVRIDLWTLAQAETQGADCVPTCRAAGYDTCWQVTGYRESQVLASCWGATREAAISALRQHLVDLISTLR